MILWRAASQRGIEATGVKCGNRQMQMLVRRQGLEPRLMTPKVIVLPLDDPRK